MTSRCPKCFAPLNDSMVCSETPQHSERAPLSPSTEELAKAVLGKLGEEYKLVRVEPPSVRPDMTIEAALFSFRGKMKFVCWTLERTDEPDMVDLFAQDGAEQLQIAFGEKPTTGPLPPIPRYPEGVPPK